MWGINIEAMYAALTRSKEGQYLYSLPITKLYEVDMNELKSFYTAPSDKCRLAGISPYGINSAADIKKICKKIKSLPEGTVVRLCGECFPFEEAGLGITRETIKALNAAGLHYVIVTRSDMVAEYADVLDKERAHIQIALSWLPNDNAVPTGRRISAIEKLAADGYDVTVRLSPYVPELVDFDRLNGIKCRKILVEFLRADDSITGIDTSHYTIKQGGYRHLPLEIKKAWISCLHYPEITVCDEIAAHRVYWQKHVNVNIDDCCNLRLPAGDIIKKRDNTLTTK